MRAIPLWMKLLGGIGLLAAVCVGLAFVPTGDVAYAPTAPIDLEGKIRVDGQVVEPLQGRMYLVGVTERKVNLLERLLLDATDPNVDFGPAPEGTRPSGPRARDVESMAQAKAVAAGVALDMVGEKVRWDGNGAVVDAVVPGTPAGRRLRPGDIISEVNRIPVDSSVDVTRVVERLAPGSRVVIGLTRAGEVRRETLRTVAPEPGDDTRRSRLGMALSTLALDVRLPYDVGIDSGEVVGPSAGLAFALYLFDSRSSIDLLHGRHVVATGALSPDGQVLPVGRVRQKVIAAQAANRDVLVVPRANGPDAMAAANQACREGSGCVQVIPVRTAREAVELLQLDEAELQARLGNATAA